MGEENSVQKGIGDRKRHLGAGTRADQPVSGLRLISLNSGRSAAL